MGEDRVEFGKWREALPSCTGITMCPLLGLRNDSICDAELDLGKPTEIGKIFAGFQKYLHQRRAKVA